MSDLCITSSSLQSTVGQNQFYYLQIHINSVES